MGVAGEIEGAHAVGVEGEVLLFEVEQQRYAVPLASVVEILRAVAVEPLPRAPGVILGVINVRGELAPVLDLRRRFGWADRALEPREHLVLLRGPGRLLAVRADRALGLSSLPEGSVDAPAELVPGPAGAHVAGIARLPDGVLLVYDLPTFLNQAETHALDAALHQEH